MKTEAEIRKEIDELESRVENTPNNYVELLYARLWALKWVINED